MATGLNIRDFTKVYRESQYTNQGSLVLSEIEHNAYLNRLTIEITDYDANRSTNFKSLPESTHWGYLTTFKGSSVVDKIPVKFAKQRVYEFINIGVWNYHQETENIRLTKVFNESAANSILQSQLLSETQTKVVDFYLDLIGNLPPQIEEDLKWILSFTYRGEEPEPPENKDYTAFPIASPYPDIFKFLSDIPLSFKFRLESWYLLNPSVYITANPTDTSDETEGEDEYPVPTAGDGNGDGSEFPPAGAPDPNADPRDYGDEQGQPGTGEWTFVISFSDPGNNAACNNVPPATLALRGFPDEPVQREFTGPPVPAGGRPGRFFTSVASAAHGGDCQVNGPGSAFFTPDGPSV
jgi:hypothetical protein